MRRSTLTPISDNTDMLRYTASRPAMTLHQGSPKNLLFAPEDTTDGSRVRPTPRSARHKDVMSTRTLSENPAFLLMTTVERMLPNIVQKTSRVVKIVRLVTTKMFTSPPAVTLQV